MSQAYSSPPGLIESFQKIISIEKKSFSEKIKKTEKVGGRYSDISILSNVSILPFFMNSIVLKSDAKYLSLLNDNSDQCYLLSLFENGLLKTVNGAITHIPIRFTDKKDRKRDGLISLNTYKRYLHQNGCVANKDISDLFAKKLIKKTVNRTNFEIPRNTEQCKNIISGWRKNIYTPYFCHIANGITSGIRAKKTLISNKLIKNKRKKIFDAQIKRSTYYRSIINLKQESYLINLCSSFEKEEHFCQKYLTDNIWTEIATGESPKFMLDYKCMNAKKLKRSSSTKDLKSCAIKFKQDPSYCRNHTAKGFPALFPYPDCDQISNALKKAHLITKYHDCPGNVDNEGIINIHRIINHFKPNDILSSNLTCANEANTSFADLNIGFQNKKAWPLKICFHNKVTSEEDCKFYIPGSSANSKHSEDSVITQIIINNEGASEEERCKIVDSIRYNPSRLGYKAGCFIVYDAENCSPLHCEKKIIYNQREVKHIKYVGFPVFDYFPTSFSNEKYSMSNIISETYHIKSKLIRNLTELQYFLSLSKKAIIHGIACAEDIYPQFFKTSAINQCRPLPFIIDGVKINKTSVLVVLRTSIDDIHSPKLVSWNRIFSAVSSYRNLHPLSTWTMYGIK